jgi:hypothetical protein
MYLRFVEGTESQDGRWLTGVITAAKSLLDDDKLQTYEADIVTSTFDWLNENIPCPPFKKNIRSGKWSRDAVAWFRPEAKEAIRRMWELVAVLEENGVPVRVLRSSEPGLIVYRDEHQIVAETAKRG